MADALALTALQMKTLTVLGSTGSIGTNTLDVVRRSRHQYQVYALAAGRNVDTLSSQILEFRPEVAVVATSDSLARLSDRLHSAGLPRAEWPELLSGEAALIQIAAADVVDTVISAIVGVPPLGIRNSPRPAAPRDPAAVAQRGQAAPADSSSARRQSTQNGAPTAPAPQIGHCQGKTSAHRPPRRTRRPRASSIRVSLTRTSHA